MAEITERSIVSPDNYAELIMMLKSNDEASSNMALTIMEQSDFDKSTVYILCILKETYKEVFEGNKARFEEIYPELHRNVTHKLSEEATNVATLSFRKVYEIAVARDIKEELEFMINAFSEELKKHLLDYGFDFLHYFDIKVIPKTKQNE